MRIYIAIFLLLSLAFSADCLRSRSYDIKISLVGPNINEPIQITSQSTLVIDKSGMILKSPNLRLINHDSGDCENCIYVIEFIPNDKSKKIETSIKANLVSGRNFEDFLEVIFGEHDDIVRIRYSVRKYLQDGQKGTKTLVVEAQIPSQYESSTVQPRFPEAKSWWDNGIVKGIAEFLLECLIEILK